MGEVMTTKGKIRFPYPPCRIGLFSEKPVRHDFQIVLDSEGHALTYVRNGVTYYKVRCTECGLNDPKGQLH